MADLRQAGAGNQDAGRPMMIPAAYRIIPPARKSSPAIMSADWKTEELPAISKMPRSRLHVDSGKGTSVGATRGGPCYPTQHHRLPCLSLPEWLILELGRSRDSVSCRFILLTGSHLSTPAFQSRRLRWKTARVSKVFGLCSLTPVRVKPSLIWRHSGL